MARSELDDRFESGYELIDHIRDDELGLLADAHESRRHTLFNHWHGLARAEELVRREYTGRYLFELLQNANDAILDWYEQHPRERERTAGNLVRLELTSESLLAANFGLPFGENNIRALCQFGDTTKSASKQIGHKGIGFKSVLEITDNPEVYSDCYAFGFDRDEFIKAVRRQVGRQSEDDSLIPVLLAPFRRRLGRLPPHDRQSIEHLFEQGYVTVIRLPLKEKIGVEQVEERMRADLVPEVLLFLNAIDQLEISYPSGEDVAYWRRDHRAHSGERSYKVVIYSDQDPENTTHSQWLMVSADEVLIRNRDLVADLGEAWKDVHAVRFAVAFPLDGQGNLAANGKGQPFHVYFPTEEPSGLSFLIHGDFYIESARKDIRRNGFNDWLSEELAIYLSTIGVQELKRHFPGRAEVVDILAPIQEPDRKFAHNFLDNYLHLLSDSPFVPLTGGQYKPPSLVRFAPEGADADLFRRFFPPSLLRGEERWAFPGLEVEGRELARDRRGHPFLLREELCAQRVDIADVVGALKDGPTIPVKECAEFFAFLAGWWDQLRGGRRTAFVNALKECRIIPTQSGWKRPGESMLFQANLRLEQDIDIPAGFEFELVTIEAYGRERSYRGIQANFLRELGVSDYQRRDMLRRAILPILQSPERFSALLETTPNAVYEAYRFLKDYYDEERSKADIADDLLMVPVPARPTGCLSEPAWQPAGEVYFSRYWTGSDDLETIFGSFDDVCFLDSVDELGLLDEEARRSWYGFFSWLGVSHRPRVMKVSSQYGWSTIRHDHPFSNRSYWAAYVDSLADAFKCDNAAKAHGRSRVMETSYAIDHFEELAQGSDVATLTALFRLLGLYWEDYRSCLTTRLSCFYTSTGCPSASVPSYLRYCLQEVAWVPAIIWGQICAEPFKPADIWALGDDAPPEVQRLVPALPDEFREEAFRAIRADLMRSHLQFEDYLTLLMYLPDRYDLDRRDLDEGNLKRWRTAVGAVSYWACQALQNALVRRGFTPPCPDNLSLLAFRGENPYYVSVGSKELVYPDDPFLAREWSEELLYFRSNDDWTRLREWLGIPNLSDRIKADREASPDLTVETEIAKGRYNGALPFFLAVVQQTQPSNYNRALVRMRRLDIHVVETLSVQQIVPDLQLPPKRLSERVHLQLRDDPNPRGGRPVRAGDLYITHHELENPDLLGGYIANYIEIERLSDAFVVLYGRQDDAARWRYLDSKGITRTVFEAVWDDLQETEDGGEVHPALKELDRKFEQKVASVITFTETKGTPTPPPEEPVASTGTDRRLSDDGPTEEPREPKYPELDLEGVIGFETYQAGSGQAAATTDDGSKPGNGGRRRPGHHPPSEKTRTMIGRRGERWAYEMERQRLRDIGINPDMLEKEERLVWVSQRDAYANHDIKSVDQGPEGLTDIWIEVKSTGGTERTAEWSIGEFQFAASLGDRYWLYWVSHADRARPHKPVRYQNPVKLWQDGEIALDFRQLEITLPEAADES